MPGEFPGETQAVTPLINAAENAKVANSRVPNAFYKIKGVRFPTTKEVEAALVSIPHKNDPFPLKDRFFPDSSTFATEIEAYLTRTDAFGNVGMTFPSQYETEVRTMDYGQKVDMAKQTWSPANFKESKRWGERELLTLGRLADDVSQSQALEEIAMFITRLRQRMVNRKRWLAQQVLTTGKITLDRTSPENPNKIVYTVDYQIQDFEIALPVKFDEKDINGKSRVDPVEFVVNYNRSVRYYPGRQMVEWIVNSNFVEFLTDNTFIQTLIDFERGVTTSELIRPSRSWYRQRALEIFARYAGITVTLEDAIYEDSTGQQKYWVPDAQAIVILGNTGALGKFIHTAHLHAGNGQGQMKIGTGDFMFAHDMTKTANPYYELIGGFNGLPKLEGYDPETLQFHRLKKLVFAAAALPAGLVTPLPMATNIGAAIV